MDPAEGIGQDTPAGFERLTAGRSPLDVAHPMHDLYPAMDARFVLVEIGKLTTKVDALVGQVDKLGSKVDTLRSQVSFVKGAAWVLGALIIVVGPLIGLLVSGKVSLAIH